MKYNPLRPAIAMIELIFAIVVMGIAMLSIPLMLESATRSSSVAFQQESIAIIASHANSMMTYAWDDNNTQEFTPTNLLTVTNGDDEIDGNSTLNQINQIRTLDVASNASLPILFGFKNDTITTGSVVHEEIIPDDVDDFHNTETNLTIALDGEQVSNKGDYMDISISMRTQITYLDDTANYSACATSTGCAFSKTSTQWDTSISGSSNIKLITTSLTSSNVTQKQIELRSFMCNIGAAQPNIRESF